MEICAIIAPDWQPFVATVEGRFIEASNTTLLGETADGDTVVYKPVVGIQPLWDFEAPSLVLREVWTYRIDRALGTQVVPETVMGDGIYGPGAVQRFVDARADSTVVELINSVSPRLWPIAVLDAVTNNADRKAGHILRGDPSELWAIDHGLTFHVEPKLRTILWGLAGRPIPAQLLAQLGQLRDLLNGELGAAFVGDLSAAEFDAMADRIDSLLESEVHPHPPDHRPAMPWPPF